MPFIFRPQQRRCGATVRASVSARIADEIVQTETIDRLTLWPTLRIRACLRLQAAFARTRPR